MDKSRAQKLADELVRFGRQAKQGMSFGFADEAQDALIAAPLAAAFSDMSYSEALKTARELSQAELQSDKDSPITSFAGQVAGSVPLGFTKAGLSAANWVRGGGAMAGAAKSAALGAGLGGASGVGAAGDSVGERVSGGGTGAAYGALLGGVTSPLARMGKPNVGVDYANVTKKVAKQTEGKAAQELARQLAARPDLPEQLARAENMAAASQRAGIPLTLAEMVAQSSNDPLLAQQAVLATNPMTAGQMAKMYAARSGTPQETGAIENRLIMLAKELSPDVNSYDEAANVLINAGDKAAGKITKDLVAQASPLYEQARASQIDPNDVLFQNPLIQDVIKKVKSNPVYAQEIGGAADNSIQVLDAVKRSLDDMAESANRSGNRNEARLIQNARTQLLETADKAAPVYAQARSVYSGNPEALQMRQQIGGLADIDPLNAKEAVNALYGGTQQNAELAAQALGESAPTAAAARIYNAMDIARGDPTTLASKIAPDKRTTDMLRAYAGEKAAPLEETLNLINQAKLGERMRYGSPTQPRMEAEKGLETAANAAIDVATGGKTTLLRRIAGMFGKGDEQTDPQFYADMADLMLTDKGMDLLRRVASGQQNAIVELQNTALPSVARGLSGKTSQALTAMPVGRAAIPYMQNEQQPQPQMSMPISINESRMRELDALLQQGGDKEKRLKELDDIVGGKNGF